MLGPEAEPDRPDDMAQMVSFVARLRALAEAAPDAVAVTSGDETLTRAELEAASERFAHRLVAEGVRAGDMVSIVLPNSAGWFVALIASWKVGATPQPISSRAPERERDAIIALAKPSAVVDRDPLADDGPATPEEPLPDVVSASWKAPTSGGSTGRPKLIVSGDPAEMDADAPIGSAIGIAADGCLVMPGPMYHNGPLIWSTAALLSGSHVVLLPRFDPVDTLRMIEKHRADVVYLVPTMMRRIWKLPDDVRDSFDLSSLRVVWHLAEPCPAWLKQCWIDWLGPERIVELYGGTEGQLSTVINGVEWLEHRGSVGSPLGGSIKICDADGNELPPNEHGEVWLKTAREKPSYRYVGAEARVQPGGWESLGDIGWLDEDGYLYLADRSSDMILVGGANVYPAEIESALNEHPLVASSCVIGIPDEDKGNRIHAIIEPAGTIDEADLLEHLRTRLVVYKLPRTFEFVDEPLRDEAGKVRRSELREHRLATGSDAR